MNHIVNDRWEGSFYVEKEGVYTFTLHGWVNLFRTWAHDLEKRLEAEQDISIDLQIGLEMLERTRERAGAAESAGTKPFGTNTGSRGAITEAGTSKETARDIRKLDTWIRECRENLGKMKTTALLLDEGTAQLVDRYVDQRRITTYGRELQVLVERERAGFSAWYELFPRSCAGETGTGESRTGKAISGKAVTGEAGGGEASSNESASGKAARHGTFDDCRKLLPQIAEMGFDVLYLPPIHPIGEVNRKGKNNNPLSRPGDPGSPWAIGSKLGGHTAVHPGLGTLDDFKKLVKHANKLGLEVAIDLAFQCAPDHPWVSEHPEWFRWRPDGTVQYAENPPKKYEDILPLNFESDNWEELWEELKRVVLFWVDAGVTLFRVDNPHTKPFNFWQWLIAEVRSLHPGVFFLSEAFTRPKVMYRLAKIGFSQSYTYFTWRNTKWELTQYLRELTETGVADFFRPNFWPNTPDILPEHLQYGGKPAFAARLVLAATLSSNYGIYGPAYELCEAEALPGREEYLNSEKYEIKSWDRESRESIRDLITLVNQARRANPALQKTNNITFCDVHNESLICYLKTTDDLSNLVLVAVNIDPYNTQAGMVKLPLDLMNIRHDQPFVVHDLLSDSRYIWQGEQNYIQLNPALGPAHLFVVHPYLHHEEDFDYFM
jgi:starch synthase (maltosyl-transferring)